MVKVGSNGLEVHFLLSWLKNSIVSFPPNSLTSSSSPNVLENFRNAHNVVLPHEVYEEDMDSGECQY